MSKFKFDENLSEQFKQRLKDALTSIQNTAIGRKLIDMLASKAGDIKISDNGQASVQGSTLFIGIMNDDPGAFAGHYTTLSLGHEMVHLLQNAEYGTTRSEISYEVEARLVEYHLAKQLNDLANFSRNFSDDSYQQSFVDFAEGRTGSINDFNNLIDGFKDGTNGGAFYNGYDESHVDSFDDIIIDEILR